jgi:hypothetical protein
MRVDRCVHASAAVSSMAALPQSQQPRNSVRTRKSHWCGVSPHGAALYRLPLIPNRHAWRERQQLREQTVVGGQAMLVHVHETPGASPTCAAAQAWT